MKPTGFLVFLNGGVFQLVLNVLITEENIVKDCLHVAFFSPFFTVLNGAFFWVVQDQMEVFTYDNNAPFNAVNGCGTHF